MSPRTAKVISRGIVVACLAMIVVDVALLTNLDRRGPPTLIVVGDASAPGMAEVRAEIEERLVTGELTGMDPLEPLPFGALALAWVLTGSLIVSRQPRNLAGWIFCLVGAAVPINGLAFAYVVYGVRIAEGGLPALDLAAMISEHSFATFALIPLLLLVFPNGRPPSPRWAWAVRLLVAGFVLAVGAFALEPGPLNNLVDSGILYANPLGLEAFAGGGIGAALVPVGVLTMLGTFLATVIAVRQRFRRAVGEERQQMRWLVTVATMSGVSLAVLFVWALIALLLDLGDSDGPPVFEILWLLTALMVFLGIPVAYLVSIFRYRLWELDVVVRKAVVAALVVAGVTAVGFLVLALVPIAFVGIRPDVSAMPVVVGLILGLLVGPLRRRARRLADRLVYGKRATPYEVLSEFSDHVAGTYSTDDVLPRMAQILAAGTGAEAATVWLRIGDELRPTAVTDGQPRTPIRLAGDELPGFPKDEQAIEVSHQGELLGALSVAMPASDPLDPAREKLVRDLASQAGLVLRNVKLIEDLKASRQRLVAAQDEERRKIERNIHDGVQQQLVALTVKLRLAQGLVPKDTAAAEAMLGNLQTESQEALEDLRDLARGIYPPLLADRGLAEALTAQTRRSAVPVEIETDGIGRYSRAVESAVYFCALEALNNVAKYAEASGATVTLEEREERLTFTVTDDGLGFDPGAIGYGTGLQGMADRLDAIGGTLQIESSPGMGTAVRGSLPIAAAEGRA